MTSRQLIIASAIALLMVCMLYTDALSDETIKVGAPHTLSGTMAITVLVLPDSA